MNLESCDEGSVKKRTHQTIQHAIKRRQRRRGGGGTGTGQNLKNNATNNNSFRNNRNNQWGELKLHSKHFRLQGSLFLLVGVLGLLPVLQVAFGAWAGGGGGGGKPLMYEDLIEGRLDTRQLCGTRFPSLEMESHQASGGGGGNNLLYIVGGDEVEDDQFWPWSVAIYELDPLNGHRAFICSGSLISDKYILTAAHCIQQSRFDILSADEIFLKIASVRLDDDRVHFYQVESVHVHPQYSVDRKANDIALLKLMRGQRLPARARPICLPSQVANRIDFTDQQVTIIGWGKTSAMHGNEPTRLIDAENNETNILSDGFDDSSSGSSSGLEDNSTDNRNIGTNDTLLQAEVRVTSTDQCNRNYSRLEISWLNIDEHFLCASDPHGKRDACQGDSGGPLMWNNQQEFLGHSSASEKWYQLGLVSFGHGCANSHYPGVYTRISYYMPWILKIVNARRGG